MKKTHAQRIAEAFVRRSLRRKVDGIVLLDKPAGVTSNVALQRVKRMFRAEKAGHTGSLDPLATGMLPICLGEATKLSSFLLDADKTYRGRARLGVRTDSGDIDGAIVESRPVDLSEDRLRQAAIALHGPLTQVPPMYSAIKKGGVPLYTLARAGIEIDRESRHIVIHRLELKSFDGLDFDFEVQCSKGTYVRTLIEDWVARCGQLAHLTALRRIAVSPFAESMPLITLGQLDAAGDDGLSSFLLPPLIGVADWPRVTVPADRIEWMSRGHRIETSLATTSKVAIVDHRETLLGIGAVVDGYLQPRRWLASQPQKSTQRLA